jgi:hypothetical protein
MASEPGQIERVEGEEFDSIAQAEHDFAILRFLPLSIVNSKSVELH